MLFKMFSKKIIADEARDDTVRAEDGSTDDVDERMR
jgi:hypothetical protein